MNTAKKITKISLLTIAAATLALLIWLTSAVGYMTVTKINSTPWQEYGYDRWDIQFPADAEVEYSFSNTSKSWFGDGEIYSVIKCKDVPDELLKGFSNENFEKASEKYCDIVNRLVKNGMDESKIIYPDERFLIKKIDKKYYGAAVIAYFEETNTFYVAERRI